MQVEARGDRWLTFMASIAGCMLAGCGGEPVAGIEGSGIQGASAITSVGTISGFGSIIVGGVEYTTSNAQIRIDDQPAAESQLRVGDIVTITGTINADGTTGTANEVTLSSDVRGAISQVTVAQNSFVVLGQTVHVTGDTLFDQNLPSPELSGLPIGTNVQVSAFTDAAGDLVASRIDLSSTQAELQVRGTVKSLDSAARTFGIEALTVDYSSASVSGALSSGVNVIVQARTLSAAGVLVATRVTAAPSVAGNANERGDLDGLITDFVSNSEFTVDGQRIATNANTHFVLHGIALGPDVEVKVKGTFDTSGVLVASMVQVKQKGMGLALGPVDAVYSDAHTLIVLGVAVATSDTTVFEDRSSANERTFKLGDIRAGDYVEIRAAPDPANGGLGATRIMRQEPNQSSSIEGTVSNVSAPAFVVLGVSVMTNSKTRFLGPDGGATDAAAFFGVISNQKVKVRGSLSGRTLTADQVQLRR
jgi:hypothetical protein